MLIKELLKEDCGEQLISRGCCIVDLNNFDESIVDLYSQFHDSIEKFFQMPFEYKQKYAVLQFKSGLNSPNQCHGYSEVSTLKDQFMMRRVGYPRPDDDNDKEDETKSKAMAIFNKHTLLFPDECDEFGIKGMKYEKLDLLCRKIAKSAMIHLNKNEEIIDDVLDPIYKINDKCNDKYTNLCQMVIFQVQLWIILIIIHHHQKNCIDFIIIIHHILITGRFR